MAVGGCADGGLRLMADGRWQMADREEG